MTKQRIPEGGAINDTPEMTMEQYSETMKKQLNLQYVGFAKKVLKQIPLKEKAKVLEIGPGPGWAGINLVKQRLDIFLDGLEASEDMIRVATKNAKNEQLNEHINYLHSTAEEMEQVADKTYDLVISRDSLHHWEDPQRVFRQINRVLAKPKHVLLWSYWP